MKNGRARRLKGTVRRLLIAWAALAGVAAVPASANDSGWRGPGWYLTYIVSDLIVTGPYSTEADCNADKANRNPNGDLSCEYLANDPG